MRSINFLISESHLLCPEQGGEWDHLSVLACAPPSVLARSDQEILGPKGGPLLGVPWACPRSPSGLCCMYLLTSGAPRSWPGGHQSAHGT